MPLTQISLWAQFARNQESGDVVADPIEWAEPSLNGVTAPIAPMGLADREVDSPARRSPQVRAAQVSGSRRPDLLSRQPSDR